MGEGFIEHKERISNDYMPGSRAASDSLSDFFSRFVNRRHKNSELLPRYESISSLNAQLLGDSLMKRLNKIGEL